MYGCGQMLYIQNIFVNFNNNIWYQMLGDMDRYGGWLIHMRGEGLREYIRGFQGEIIHVY